MDNRIASLKAFAAWMQLRNIQYTGNCWIDCFGKQIASDFDDLIPYYIEDEKRIHATIVLSEDVS